MATIFRNNLVAAKIMADNEDVSVGNKAEQRHDH